MSSAKSCFFQSRVVIGVEIVETIDDPAVGKKPARQMKANEPSGAGHKNGLSHATLCLA